MLSIQLLAVCPLLYSFACAKVIPRETRTPAWPNNGALHINTTATHTILTTLLPAPTPTGAPQKCCFLVQDEVSEVWWEQTSYSTSEETVTTFTYFETAYPNTTITNSNSSVHTSTFISSELVGANPLTLMDNTPLPTQITTSLTGTQPITTAGVVIQSPAAFFVYSTVRIITADQVVDENGNYACGTASGIFTSINSNAQAYFGGGTQDAASGSSFLGGLPPDISSALPSDTPTYTPLDVPTGTPVDLTKRVAAITNPLPVATPADPTVAPTAISPDSNASAPTPTVLILTQPFIYQPKFASRGGKSGDGRCRLGQDAEDYGFIPQTLLDHLVGNQHYLGQYAGLKDCLPAGPSFMSRAKACPVSFADSSTVIAIGGDLTTSVTVKINRQGISAPLPTKPPTNDKPNNVPIPIIDGSTNGKGNDGKANDGKGKDPVFIPLPAGGTNSNPSNGNNNNDGSNDGKQNNNNNNNQQGSTNQDPSIGSIIDSIINGGSNDGKSHVNEQPPAGPGDLKPIVFTAATVVPVSNAPIGLTGDIKTINGQPNIVVPGPTTIAPAPGNFANNAAGSTRIIDGTPFIIIPAATNLLPDVAPAGVKGSTTVIDGKSYFALPGPITYAAPANLAANIGSTKVIDGTAYMVIPSATNIPLADAPAGLRGSTTIVDGKPFLVVPGPITYAATDPKATQGAGTTLLIGDVPFVVYPSGKNIPLPEAIAAGINGVTKTIDGKTFVSPPDATTVPAINTNGGASYGSTTLIDNTPYLLLPTGKPIPASLFPSGLGADAKTTNINGEDFVIIASSTRVPLPLASKTGLGGQLTVIIDGSSRLIIAGPTTMPLNSYFDIKGSKTVISGTTMVIVTGATTVAGKTTSSDSSASTAEPTRTPTAILPVPTGADQAPGSGVGRNAVGFEEVWMVLCMFVGILIIEL